MIYHLFVALSLVASLDGPQDNIENQVRPIPPKGVEIPAADLKELEQSRKALTDAVGRLRQQHQKNATLLALLPDVEIFEKAVRDALQYKEIFTLKEVPFAKAVAAEGIKRAEQLAKNEHPWTTATGLVVRGYRSHIDDSVQPYGMVVPASYHPHAPLRFRLDGWFHGRGETLSEVNFIYQRMRNPGEFTPPHTLVLHPYGRYCNANKFAGEIDFLEALEHAKTHYSVDENRIVVRGFSMGGAACWQFAVHYADRWAAAAPGAGFSETPDFLKVFQQEKLRPAWYEQKLWRWYDCTDWAMNLHQCPTVAYSGEIDRQKQAADMMEKALAKEDIALVHIIGPKTAHAYHPAAKIEINERINALAAIGRTPVPDEIHFTTYTLRYPSMHWITVEGMGEHWEKAEVHARMTRSQTTPPSAEIRIKTKNVTALDIHFGSGQFPFGPSDQVGIVVDGGKRIPVKTLNSDRSLRVHLQQHGLEWQPARMQDKLRKHPGLQGPIDDAFMDRFLFVTPSGKSEHSLFQKWVEAELAHGIAHWRSHFRGDVRIKKDTELTADDVRESHLILWGDPSSNAYLRQVAGELPIHWENSTFKIGPQSFDRSKHAPVCIYPNPKNRSRYVVLNSGFTFREYDYLNNARQTPKLPDWAVFDLGTPRTSRGPGTVVDADFFDESWEYKKSKDRK